MLYLLTTLRAFEITYLGPVGYQVSAPDFLAVTFNREETNCLEYTSHQVSAFKFVTAAINQKGEVVEERLASMQSLIIPLIGSALSASESFEITCLGLVGRVFTLDLRPRFPSGQHS